MTEILTIRGGQKDALLKRAYFKKNTPLYKNEQNEREIVKWRLLRSQDFEMATSIVKETYSECMKLFSFHQTIIVSLTL